MLNLSFACLLLLRVLITASQETDETVVALSEDNFDNFVSENKLVLVEFYAPWCGHCKSLAPEYEKAAKALIASEPSVILAKVDATVETQLAAKFDVSGYPTLKFIQNGHASDYDGPRDADGIVDHIKSIADPNYKPPPEAVVALTDSDQFEVVKSLKLTLVEFYAPWCGHCKKLAPEYEKAAKRLQAEHDITIYKVDATKEEMKEVAKEYGVSGYPTLKVYKDGKAMDYKGPRDGDGIFNYMVSLTSPAATPLQTAKDLKSLLTDTDDVVILGVFEEQEGLLFDNYMDTAENMRDEYNMFHTNSEELRKVTGLDSEAMMLIYKPTRYLYKGEDKLFKFPLTEKTATVTDLVAVLQEHDTALIGERTKSNTQTRYANKKPLCVLYVPVDWSFDYKDMTNSWKNKLLPVALHFAEKGVTFAMSDETAYEDELKSLGLEDSGSAFNLGCYNNLNKYPLEELDEWEAEEVEEFIQSVVDGKAKPYFKSAIPPKKQKGPVTVVVGKTFDQLVRDQTKDVLLEIYAPWCGHCKKLEPIYKNLAKQLSSEKNLVIAKMDGTANDAPPDFPINGFPTIYFLPADEVVPKLYEGGRTLDEMKTYLRRNSRAAFKGSKDEL